MRSCEGRTYEATLVATLLQTPRLYNTAQEIRVDLGGGLEHLAGALRQYLGVAIQTRKVQGHQQGAGLDIVDTIGEEVGDGVGDLVGGDAGVLRPETAEEVLDIDDGRWL